MKGHLLIVLSNNDTSIELSPYIYADEYMVTIYVKDMASYETIINNDELFEEMVENYENTFGFEDDNGLLLDYISKNKAEIKSFLLSPGDVSFTGDVSEVREYIDKNGFSDRNIFYNEMLPLKRECLERVTEYFSDLPNMNFLIDGNNAPVKLEEYIKTVEKIELIAKNVRALGLSPLEEIMYVYDLVRDRNYIEEDDNEEYTVSRDLTSVLFGEKIVCAGFAVMFNSILNCLGYKTMDFVLTPLKDTDAHMRSLVYVKDDKYEIDGMYFFDPTYDCKKGDNNSFLEKYFCFARTYNQMMRLDKGKLDNTIYRFMDEDEISEIDDMFEKDEIFFVDLLRKIRLPFLNRILRFSGQEEINVRNGIIYKEDLIEKIYEISLLANCDITYETFLGVLYNVRKQQYYQDPEKYAFDMNEITNILIKSKVADKGSSDQERLLMAILGSTLVVSKKTASEKVKRYFEENDLEKDMERVKLARVLKTVLEQKEDEEKRLTFKSK